MAGRIPPMAASRAALLEDLPPSRRDDLDGLLDLDEPCLPPPPPPPPPPPRLSPLALAVAPAINIGPSISIAAGELSASAGTIPPLSLLTCSPPVNLRTCRGEWASEDRAAFVTSPPTLTIPRLPEPLYKGEESLTAPLSEGWRWLLVPAIATCALWSGSADVESMNIWAPRRRPAPPPAASSRRQGLFVLERV